MRFASFGLVALTGLLSTAFAAPAAQLEGVSGISNVVTGVVGGVTGSGSASGGASGSALGGLGGIIKRTDEELCDKLSSTLATVKEHTGTINSTVASYQKSKGDKAELIVTIKGEVTVIVSLLATLVADISALVSDIGSITGELKTRVVGLVWSIIVEILFTLKYTLAVVKISIWELLGGLIIALLSVCFSLLAVLNVLAGDILKLVFGLLGSVHGILTLVLGGLSVIIKDFLGGFLSIVGNVGGIFGGIMSCIL